jgi:tetratricopeptide (TPR) repeat protein
MCLIFTLYGNIARPTRVKRQIKAPPAVSPYFVVRKDQWETLETCMAKSQGESIRVLVITGMGGCGKTQMVSYFVQKFSSRYASVWPQVNDAHFICSRFKHIFFIDASSQSGIKNDLRNAIRCIDGHQQDTDEEALFFLAENPDSLLIFDNADDPKLDLVPFFPKSYKGIILITSRLRGLGELATLHHLELGPMLQEEAIETLARASRRALPISVLDAREMNELVEELGCLPLALVQAGVYIFNMGTVQSNDSHSSLFQQYLSLFRKGRAALMRKEGTASLDQYRRGVYSTLDLSYGLLPPLARDLLGLCSQFHYTNISLSMILTAANRKFEDKRSYLRRPESHEHIKERLRALLCPDGSWSELHVRDIIQSLASFSLAQIAVANDTILLRFHPLVHSWAHEMLSREAASEYRMMVTTVLSTSLETMPPAHLQYVPQHIVKVVEETPPGELHITDAIIFGGYLGDNGMGKMGIELLEDAVKRLKEEAGPNHIDTIDATVLLCDAYLEFGKMKEPEALLSDALEVQRTIRGEEHVETMKTHMLLLSSRLQQGRYEECLDALIKLQKMFQERIGENQEDTLLTASLLAMAYTELGKREEAAEIQRRVLKIQQETLGERHPDTFTTLNCLATTYLYMGKTREAEVLYIKVLDTSLEVLGQKHPMVVTVYNNLARTYQVSGKLKEAEELQVKVVESMEEMMGWHHPDTLSAASNLALMYFDLKKNDEALELNTKVLEKRREVLGEQHPDTLMSYSNLSITYFAMNRLKEAEDILLKAYKSIEEMFGRRHPSTVLISDNLASVFRKLGKLKEAEEMQLENIEAQRELYGEENPDTLITYGNLAITYHDLGKDTEAKKAGQHFVETGKAVFGESHPTYLEMIGTLTRMNIVTVE